MKRLLALLFLVLCSPAVAQQIDWSGAVNVPNVVVNPTMNDCPSGGPTCGAWREGGGFAPGDWTNQFGTTEYVFSYFQNTLYQDIDLSQYNTNLFNFTFQFDLNNSCRNSIGGYCENVNGPIDFISASIYFYDENGLNNQFTFLNGNISTARIECNGGIEIFGVCIFGQFAADNWEHFGWYSHVQSDVLFTSARIEFTGRDVGFWGGLYGPRIDNPTLQINYMPYIPEFLYWNNLTGENGTFTLTEPGVVRYGADGVYAYKSLEAGTYECSNNFWGDPIGYVVKSCELGTNTPLVTSVDCTTDPFNVACVIDTIGIDDGVVDYTDPEQIVASLQDDTTTDDTSVVSDTSVADETTTSTDDDTPVEETVAATDEESNTEQTSTQETTLEKLLVDEEKTTDKTSTEEKIVASRELSDDEKAAVLADAISKSTLEAALSVAVNAELAGATQTTAAVTESTTVSTESSTKTASANIVADTATEAGSSVVSSQSDMVADNAKEESSTSDNNAGADVLETGRQLGQAALAVTLNATAESASDSTKQAESVASTSSTESQTVVMSNVETAPVITDAAAQSNTESDTTQTQVVDASNTQQEQVAVAAVDVATETTVTTETSTIEQIISTPEIFVADVTQTEQSSAIEFTSIEAATDMFAAKLSNQTDITEQQELENNIVQQSLVSSQQQQEDSKDTFSEAEVITITNDPALANAFNIAPNMANLEVTGALSQKQEEKSDAEKMADKVVAANKEEQEKINSNYMDADQSGIVAAISADTDVTSYRTAMIRDNNIWYKPEDIYKNIVYKDNVRGAYFLEKGNTDTYKKMVEEQYK